MNHNIKIFDYFILSFIIGFLAWRIGFSFINFPTNLDKNKFFQSVIEQLLKSGADTNFVYSLIKHPKTEFKKKFVRINVIGYLNKTDYSQYYSDFAVQQCLDFINQYYRLLNKCEISYSIPKSFITSILWIESKFGKYLGSYHIPSVYLSTAMAAEPEYIEQNKNYLLENYLADNKQLEELSQKIKERSIKKSQWAINELLALGQMAKSNLPFNDYKCSWAGAFGIPQFLPSSFIKYAVDGNADGKINLFDINDAIASTANYLILNGWSLDKQSQQNAIFKYNNSSDYVYAVQTLAHKIDSALTFKLNNKN
jgi:membrane-bound lytic murein transglycosylase B